MKVQELITEVSRIPQMDLQVQNLSTNYEY